MEPGLFVLLAIALGIVFGAACGIWAAFRVRGINSQIEHLKEELSWLRRDLRRESPAREAPTPFVPQPIPPVRAEVPPKPSPVFVEAPPTWRQTAFSPVQLEVPKPDYGKPGEAPQWLTSLPSFEQMLGMKALTRVGMFMVLVGAALFLKYAYDNNYIGPVGRLAIGAAAGCIALGFGERFRRNNWPVLFQTLTGGGIAIFYICIFFSFQVYHLSAATAAM